MKTCRNLVTKAWGAVILSHPSYLWKCKLFKSLKHQKILISLCFGNSKWAVRIVALNHLSERRGTLLVSRGDPNSPALTACPQSTGFKTEAIICGIYVQLFDKLGAWKEDTEL